MSGHSKWANIKHRKAGQDAKRAKAFTKAVKELTVAAREGGGDPDANASLRTAINAARAVNLPKDKIERAIKKGTGELGGVMLEEVNYEGYGPGGVAILVGTLTDNRNRTTSDVRHLFNKYGGELGSPGSVAWMFERKGFFEVPCDGIDEDALMELALESGADDMRREESNFEIFTAPDDFHGVHEALLAAGIPLSEAEIAMIPENVVPVEGSKAETLINLLDLLEELDDVQRVSANCQIADEEGE